MVERKRDWAQRGGRSSLGLPLLFYEASPLAPRMVSVYDSKKKKRIRDCSQSTLKSLVTWHNLFSFTEQIETNVRRRATHAQKMKRA